MATLAEPREATSDEAFREEVRAFLADHFPPELKGKGNALALASAELARVTLQQRF